MYIACGPEVLTNSRSTRVSAAPVTQLEEEQILQPYDLSAEFYLDLSLDEVG